MGSEALRWASAVEQRRLLRSGEVSAAELRSAAVERIERLDPAIGAVVIPLFDRPGDGVPMLLKDAGQEIEGTPHWVGLASLRDAGATSPRTTGLVGAFERAGLTIVGRTACPPLSNGATTEPPGFPPTRNPWDPSMSAGGSSGGSAAAVAAGLVPVAHGSDATGSLRWPAALCGVATLVPSAGRVAGTPPAGQPPNEAWRDFALARHVEDLALVFEALAGGSPGPSAGRLRVGLLDHDPEGRHAVDPVCAEGVAVAGLLLEALGHDVEAAWPEALESFWVTVFAAFGVTADATRPPVLRWVEERLGRPLRPDDVPAATFDAAARAATRTADDVAAAQATVAAAAARLASWWEGHDLLVTPATFRPGWPLRRAPVVEQMGTLVAPFSLTGQPSMSLPLHRTAAGMPVGVHLIGRRGADEVLLRLAADLQEAADWTVHRPA